MIIITCCCFLGFPTAVVSFAFIPVKQKYKCNYQCAYRGEGRRHRHAILRPSPLLARNNPDEDDDYANVDNNENFNSFRSPPSPSSSPGGMNRNGTNSNNKRNSLCSPNEKKNNLIWNLPVLLSQDTGTEAMLIPLMDVYNAAMAGNQSETSCGASARLEAKPINPQKESSPPLSRQWAQSIESLDYTGKLSPNLAPFRLFVRKYSQDMVHDGRFSIFGPDDEHNNGTDSDNKVDEGASLQPEVVFSMDDPLGYIRDFLSYRDEDQNSNRFCSIDSSRDNCCDEVVVFCPGLHTIHERIEKGIRNDETGPSIQQKEIAQRTSMERVKYYSKVLDGLPMAQIHAGTYLDRGDIDIKLTLDTIKALQSFDLLLEDQHNLQNKSNKANIKEDIEREMINDGVAGTDSDGAVWCMRAKDLDIVRTVLSRANLAPFDLAERQSNDDDDTERLKRTMIKLIDTAVNNNKPVIRRKPKPKKSSSSQSPHLVLITYSATSNILAAALAEWKHRATTAANVDDVKKEGQKILSEEKAELLLHQAVTVVTIGALCKGFVDGPAYIHISMHDDILASSLGVSKQSPDGGGKDAVYLHGISPYALFSSGDETLSNRRSVDINANDAHNMDACAVQYLSLVRRINGIASFRDLYDIANKDPHKTELDIKASLFPMNYNTVGQLEMPPHLDDELLPSMIRATGGDRWLWNPKLGLQLSDDGGGVDGFDSRYAEAFLTNQLGYNVYDEIVKACCK